MSTSIQLEVQGLTRLEARLRALTDLDRDTLLGDVGALVESQTRNRIQNEKRSADGQQWEPWSPRYAATRHGNHSLLQDEGGLLDSLQYLVVGDTVQIGSNLVYAATHQHGRELTRGRIPARPYLGLSRDDEDDVVSIVEDYLDGLLAGRQ